MAILLRTHFCAKYTSCSCETSDFLDRDHGHVVTGDLRIVENKDLRNLIQKGPNYREPKFINWKKTEDSLRSDITNFIKKWSDTTGLSEVCFQEWKNSVFELLSKMEASPYVFKLGLKNLYSSYPGG